MTLNELNTALLQAHEKAAIDASHINVLVDLYERAYQLTLGDDTTAAYFYLTNAYVYALDSNDPKVCEIEMKLKNAGRL